jgi:hypothetical protein
VVTPLVQPLPVVEQIEQNPASGGKVVKLHVRKTPQTIPDNVAQQVGVSIQRLMDSGLSRLIGGNASSVVQCLYRHAAGHKDRRVTKVGYGTIQNETGLSLRKIRAGIDIAIAVGLITDYKPGLSIDGKKKTAEYTLPWPTDARLITWADRAEALRNQPEEEEFDDARDAS